MSFRYVVWQQLQRSTSPKGSISKEKSVSGTKVVCPARWRRVCFALAFARLARLRFLVSDAMCKPVLRRDRLDFGYDNRFQNPTICSRRLPSSTTAKIRRATYLRPGQFKNLIRVASMTGRMPERTCCCFGSLTQLACASQSWPSLKRRLYRQAGRRNQSRSKNAMVAGRGHFDCRPLQLTWAGRPTLLQIATYDFDHPYP